MGHESEEVSIVERCMIAPCTPTPRQELFLSCMDLFWVPFHFTRMLLFYPTPGGKPQQDAFISTLKASLAMVLVPFYPAAGRLAHSSTHSNKRVCIDCNDAGVEFLVATAPSVHFHQLQVDNFQPCPLFHKLAPYDEHLPSETFNLPLLCIQVTRLSCEGLALAYALCHVLADGTSIWNLMKSWAECARKEPISMPPLHMRKALAVEKPSQERAFLLYPPEGLSVSGSSTSPLPVTSKELLKERLFQCSGEMIRRLKDEANSMVAVASHNLPLKCGSGDGTRYRPGNGSNAIECNDAKDKDDKYFKEEHREKAFSFTSYEAMCAHWWKLVTRARGLDGMLVVRFGAIVDMRNQLSPKLPASYFGNAVMPIFTYAPAAEILQESLARTAARVHQARIACSEEYLWGFLHWLELHDQTMEPEFFSHAPRLTTVGSPHFQVDNVDYGYGRPIAVRTVRIRVDGEMALFAPADGHKLSGAGSVDICLSLTCTAMDRLGKDASLYFPSEMRSML